MEKKYTRIPAGVPERVPTVSNQSTHWKVSWWLVSLQCHPVEKEWLHQILRLFGEDCSFPSPLMTIHNIVLCRWACGADFIAVPSSALFPAGRASSRHSSWKWKTCTLQPPLQLGWPNSCPVDHQRTYAERNSLVKQEMRELSPPYSFGHEWVKMWCLELW